MGTIFGSASNLFLVLYSVLTPGGACLTCGMPGVEFRSATSKAKCPPHCAMALAPSPWLLRTDIIAGLLHEGPGCKRAWQLCTKPFGISFQFYYMHFLSDHKASAPLPHVLPSEITQPFMSQVALILQLLSQEERTSEETPEFYTSHPPRCVHRVPQIKSSPLRQWG